MNHATILPRRQHAAAKRCAILAKWTLAIGLLASLLFAHGCHGHDDHELFGEFVACIGSE